MPRQKKISGLGTKKGGNQFRSLHRNLLHKKLDSKKKINNWYLETYMDCMVDEIALSI